MSQVVCPACGEELKENGFYLKQYINYCWDINKKRFVISDITPGELLTCCCDVKVEEVIENVQTIEEYYEN